MAQLNEFEIDPSLRNLTPDTVALPNRPVDKKAVNAIARITPKESRGYAKLAYTAWVESGMSTPWDGVYTDHEGPQNLTYLDE